MEQHAKKINIVKCGLKYVTVVSFGDVKLTFEEDGRETISYHDKQWDSLARVDDLDVIREFYGRKYIVRYLDEELDNNVQLPFFINEAIVHGSDNLKMALLHHHVEKISTDALLSVLPNIFEPIGAEKALDELVKRGQNRTNVILLFSENISRRLADKYKQELLQTEEKP